MMIETIGWAIQADREREIRASLRVHALLDRRGDVPEATTPRRHEARAASGADRAVRLPVAPAGSR